MTDFSTLQIEAPKRFFSNKPARRPAVVLLRREGQPPVYIEPRPGVTQQVEKVKEAVV